MQEIPNKTRFQSGCNGRNDIESFRSANRVIGSSIDYFKGSKLTSPFPMAIQEALNAHEACFLDNGFIQYLKRLEQYEKGKLKAMPVFDVKGVLKRYIEIVDFWNNTQYLTIVMPDCPLDEVEAVKTITDNQDAILYLNARCRVMIPIHRPTNKNTSLTEQALKLAKAMNYRKFTLGVPCLDKFRLTEEEIKELLSIKVRGKPYFTDLHFLGVGVKSKKNALAIREAICDGFGVTCSSDVSRIGSIWGNEEIKSNGKVSSARKGTVLKKKIEREYDKNKKPVIKTMPYWDLKVFKKYTLDNECESPLLHDFFNYECSPKEQYYLYNAIVAASSPNQHNNMLLTGASDDYLDNEWQERIEQLCDYLGDRFVIGLVSLLTANKASGVDCTFDMPCIPHGESRKEAIVSIFNNKSEPQPIQKDLFVECYGFDPDQAITATKLAEHEKQQIDEKTMAKEHWKFVTESKLIYKERFTAQFGRLWGQCA